MPNLFQRMGAAFTAFRSATMAGGTATRGSAWPFDRIPLIGGSAGGDKLVRPYENSVWVQRAIKKIAGPVAAVDLCFRDPVTQKKIEDEPWVNFWDRPARGLSRFDFIEAIIGWLKLAGESFIILQPEFTAPFPEVMTAKQWSPLILARPDRMRSIKDSSGQLIGWEFTASNSQRIKLSLDQVVQVKYWNPYDDIRGMSEYEAAQVASESDYLAGKFALNLSRANGDTGVLVMLEGGGQLDDGQRKQINDALRLKREKSLRGEFSSILIPAGVKVEDPKVKSTDANFVAQRLENRHEIYIAFGVPPSMADVVASYSVGSASDRYLLIEDTCIPTGDKICEAISPIASRQAGREVEAYFEWNGHPVMQQVRRERIDSGTKLFDRGMPWKTVSEYLGLDLPTFSGDSTGYIPFSLAPVGEATDPKAQPETSPAYEEEEDPVQEAIRALTAKPATKSYSDNGRCGSHCGCSLEDTAMQRDRDPKEIALWKSIVAKRRETMRAYESKFNRVLMTARAEVIGKLERASKLDPEARAHLVDRAVAADFMFNAGNFKKTFFAAMRGVATNALQSAGDQIFAELKKDDPWKMPQAETLEYLADRDNRLAGVPDDVFDRVKGRIESGLNAGDPLSKIADAVRAEFNDISSGRARMIAQTETAAAYGFGRHEAMVAAGVQFKRWLTSGNANVRDAHQAMNGAVVSIDEPFFVIDPKTGDSDEIMHPGDSDGEPWNVINCHCVELASVTGPADEEES